jgi:hypothetical protein
MYVDARLLNNMWCIKRLRLYIFIIYCKVVKNAFLTRHEIYNINSDCKIVKSQEKYFNYLYIDNFSQVVNNNITQLK